MSATLPRYFFRARDSGAVVFSVNSENRMRRIEMEAIASVNLKSGEVHPRGERTLEPADLEAIRAWVETRRETLARREIDDIRRTIDHLNSMTSWVNNRASDDDLDAVTGEILLAMHDLRSVLVRRRAGRAEAEKAGDTAPATDNAS